MPAVPASISSRVPRHNESASPSRATRSAEPSVRRSLDARPWSPLRTAQAHIASALRHSRTTARRDRQVVEIAALVVAGHCERAAGLAAMHTAEFPDDADLLARVAATKR